MKKLSILLLFIIFTNSLTSMQIQKEKVEKVLDLPNEILDCIIKQVIEKDFLETLNNWNSVFEEAPKPDLILIKNLGQSCKIFCALCKDNLILKENLRLFNGLKKRRVEQLLNSLKNKALEEYNGISSQELNVRLTDSLNTILNVENSQEELEKRFKLIFAGADVNINHNGWSALIWATGKGFKEMVEMLLNKKANIDITNNSGDTPLIWATMFGHKEIIEILLNSGANIETKGNDQATALIWAARCNRKDIVKVLLKKNANINAQDNERYTALIWAASWGHKDIIKLLLKKNANINAQNIGGYTALMRAAIKGNKEIVEMLLNTKKADINIKNNNGDDALALAIKYGRVEIENILRKYLEK